MPDLYFNIVNYCVKPTHQNQEKTNFFSSINKKISSFLKQIQSSFFENEYNSFAPNLEKQCSPTRCRSKPSSQSKAYSHFKEVFPIDNKGLEAVTPKKIEIPKIQGEREILVVSGNKDQDYAGALRSFPTSADGSCGFHALFGKYDSDKKRFHLQDYSKKRGEFSNWIEDKFKNNDIPQEIKASLSEYLSNPGTAPHSIKKVLKDRSIQELYAQYAQFLKQSRLSTATDVHLREATDVLLIALISDKKVQGAYLEHIKDTSSYLLPSELGAAAVWSEKTINIYQNQEETGLACPPYTFNEGKKDTVDIVLSEGASHFERAVFNPF